MFADLILTTGRGRVFHCSRFAIALLFIQVAGEPREIRSERAFCNTSLWILNTCGTSSHTDARATSSQASGDIFPGSSKAEANSFFDVYNSKSAACFRQGVLKIWERYCKGFGVFLCWKGLLTFYPGLLVQA